METLSSTQACVDAIIAAVGKRIALATPLGIGKPNHLLNALYRRAKADASIELTIYTALTLERPKGKSELEQRFLGPLVERVFGNYPDLDYELDRTHSELPANVRVIEFYFQAGKFLHNTGAQRDYISSNYTHVARDIMTRGVNVLAQQVCAGVVDGRPRLSLSCNADLSLDIVRELRVRRAAGQAIAIVGQINDQLPFMHGDALVAPDDFDYIVDNPDESYTLFGPPKTPVGDADAMIGLYASGLVKDGGELQIGIGALGDALVYALGLRHSQNPRYREVFSALSIEERFAAEVLAMSGGLERFEQGLFAATEMLVDGFMYLFEAGILKRKIYDDLALSRLLNEGRITEQVSAELLDLLRVRKAIHSVLTEDDLAYLVHFGILRSELRFSDDQIVLPDGRSFVPDLSDPRAREHLHAWLGTSLQHGAVVHAGFFIGPQAFYAWLRELPEAQRRLIDMRSVTRINQLYGHEDIDRLHRRDARFVNTSMKMSLLGAATSDGVADGRVVSGVGGQYNFVAMAHELPGGRSILQVRSTRLEQGTLRSNLVWDYAYTTIPRHLRDVVITEYGIADLRAKTDEECVKALLNICDSRFQDGLLREAKRIGKVHARYVIPSAHRNNVPSAYAIPLANFRKQGLFPVFPFGTDLTADEQRLARALRRLKSMTASPKRLLNTLMESAANGRMDYDVEALLKRMDLHAPRSAKEHVYQRLIAAALRAI